MSNDVASRVVNVASAIFNLPPNEIIGGLAYNSHERWDSIAQMNLILALEEEFNIQFLDDEIEDMLTIDLIINIISSRP